MTVWFTSDPHWGHGLVSEIRDFATPQEHDEALMESYCSVIGPKDVTWWLGDLTAARPDPGLEAIAKIPGEHHLIWGNHDNGHPMHRDSYRRWRQYATVFRSMNPFLRRRIYGIEVLMSHFPYTGDHTERQRYDQYRLPDQGMTLLHGHTHSTEAVSRTSAGTLQIHVGVDAWFRPVSMEEIHHIMLENT